MRIMIWWQFAACAFLVYCGSLAPSASGQERATVRQRLALSLDYDTQASRAPLGRDAPQGISFSPDGKTLAAAFNERGVVLFDVQSGQVVARIKQSRETAMCVIFSPDGKTLAHGGSGAWLWDVTARQPKSWGEHPLWIHAMAFSRDGKTLAIGTSGRDTFRLWDLETGKSVAEFDVYAGTKALAHFDRGLYKPNVAGFALAPDAGLLAAHIHFYEDELPSFDQILVWESASRKLRAAFNGTGGLVTPDGRTLIYALEGQLRLRSTKSIDDLVTINGAARIGAGSMSVMALSSDGKTLATNSDKHEVQLWNLPDRRLIAVFKGHDRSITSLSISADGLQVASGSLDGSVRVWDVSRPGVNP